MRKSNRLAVAVGLGIALAVLAPAGAGAQGGPPFRAGEVVVAGAPSDLPAGYVAAKYLANANLTVVRVESGQEWGHIQKLREHGKRANLNLVAESFAAPNDTYYPYQWHLSKIQSDAAWAISTGAGAVVAVLDTGLKAGGPDGIGCVSALSTDIVNGDGDPTDGDGHGTHVSGTIAQNTNNAKGCAGMAYGACIMAVKVLGDDGSGSFADIADGIYYAVDKGADVINMSLGINARYAVTNDPVMDPALDLAYASNVTVVCAAGNDGNRRNVSYPAIYPTTIAVGATGCNNARVSYSNYGTGLDIMAPGGDTSKDLNGDGYVDGVLQETNLDGAWGYYFFQGTSMASPHVAAVAALLYASGVATTPETVRHAMESTALDLGTAGYDSTYGWGLVQAAAALGGGTCPDADNDGWCVSEGDCNDANGAVNPGATEVCGNGIDDDCDNQVDEGCSSSCVAAGSPCSTNAQCCSLSCNKKTKTCR